MAEKKVGPKAGTGKVSAMGAKIAGKEPPHSEESEVALLGAVLLRPNYIEKVIDIITPEDFYRGANRSIYEAMLDLYNRRDAIDIVTVTEKLTQLDRLEQAGGIEYLSELSEAVPTSHNIASYAKVIADKAILRALLQASWEIMEQAGSSRDVREIVDEAERKVFEVGQRDLRPSLVGMDEIINQSLIDIHEQIKSGGGISGISTGFSELDELTNGLHNGELIIIAARPSMGKSAFALNIAENIAIRDNVPVAIFTLEMSREQCGMRMLASNARVDLKKLGAGDADDEDFRRLTRSAAILTKAPVYIDDSGFISSDEVRAKCRRLKAEKGLGMVFIDYIQLMKPRQGITSREQQISDLSRSLKGLAKELDIPVVGLSQLNRKVEDRPDKRPHLADIRESGAIEQDADMIAFIYRHEYYEPEDLEEQGKAEVIIAKHRNGPTGKAKLAFVNRFTRFENLEKYRDDPY